MSIIRRNPSTDIARIATALDTIATMLEKVPQFAELALKEETNGGAYQDEAFAVKIAPRTTQPPEALAAMNRGA